MPAHALCAWMQPYPCQAWPLPGTMLTLFLTVGIKLIAWLRFGPLILRFTEGHCSTEGDVRIIEVESPPCCFG